MSYQPQYPQAAYHMGNMPPYVAGGQAPGSIPYSQGDNAMHYGTPVDANNADNPSGYVHDGYWSNGYNSPNNPNGYMPNVHDPNNAHDYGHPSYGPSSHHHHNNNNNNNNNGQNNPSGHALNGYGPNSHNNPNASQNDSGATTPEVKNPKPTPNTPNQASTSATMGVVAATAVTTGIFTGFGTWCFNTFSTGFGGIMDCCGGCTKCCQD